MAVSEDSRAPACAPEPACAPWDVNGMGVYYAPPSFRYTNIAKELTENGDITCILSAGMKFLYVLPGFDILGIELRHIKVKGFGKIGKEEDIFDLFIKNDLSLCRSYPAALVIKDLTVVKEEDFEQSVVTAKLNLPSQGVIVIWVWEWLDDDITHVSETTLSHHSADDVELPEEDTDSDSTHCSPQKLYTVTFKCIGAQHDLHAQETLQRVSRILDNGEVVPVNIFPEEDNPYDSRAIAFKCWSGGEWQRIGYIVKEALNAVHDARDQHVITEVCFKWAKYLVSWSRSGPGYYAGINITRHGEWPKHVHTCASTR